MLCPKCKTAVINNKKVCANCGAKIDRHKTAKASMLLFTALVAVISLFIYYADYLAPPPPDEVAENPASIDNETPEPVADTNPPEPALAPVGAPDITESRDITSALRDVAVSAGEFCEKYFEYATFVTNKGYLYVYESSQFITAGDLIGYTGVNPDNATDDMLILYLSTADLTGFDTLDIISSNELVIFAATETKDGFIIESEDNGGGILPREDLRGVLAGYSNDHGRIQPISADSDDYNQISMLIGNLYDGRASFDFRYLYKDDVYCAAITSPVNDSKQLQGHILYFENNTWFLGMAHYEENERYIEAINTRFTDMNLDIIPGYNLSSLALAMRDDYPEVISSLILSGVITDGEDEAITFQTGTGNFCYLETQTGERKFLGFFNNNNGAWDVTEVTSYEQAVNIMKEKQRDNPPIFILKLFIY